MLIPNLGAQMPKYTQHTNTHLTEREKYRKRERNRTRERTNERKREQGSERDGENLCIVGKSFVVRRTEEEIKSRETEINGG